MIHERNDGRQPKIAYYLLAPVLEVAHERLLHTIELGKLHADRLPSALQVLRALREVLAALDARRRDGEGALCGETMYQFCTAAVVRPEPGGTVTYLELLVDALQAINRRVESADLVALNLQLLLEILDLAGVRITLRCVLRLELVL